MFSEKSFWRLQWSGVFPYTQTLQPQRSVFLVCFQFLWAFTSPEVSRQRCSKRFGEHLWQLSANSGTQEFANKQGRLALKLWPGGRERRVCGSMFEVKLLTYIFHVLLELSLSPFLWSRDARPEATVSLKQMQFVWKGRHDPFCPGYVCVFLYLSSP